MRLRAVKVAAARFVWEEGEKWSITDDTYRAGDSFKGIIFYLQMKVKVVTVLPRKRANCITDSSMF